MSRIIIFFLIITAQISIFMACGGTVVDNEDEIQFDLIENISSQKLSRLSQSKIYFGHKSVGYNIVEGLKSFYLWKGKRKHGEEVLLMLKTKGLLKEEIIKEIERQHSYELPVIEFFETELNNKAAEWIEKETK